MPSPHSSWSGPLPLVVDPPTTRRWEIHNPDFDADTFDRPRRASPWAGHRWFAYDLVSFLAPASIVELGTHYGCSFFAFCQAVRDVDLPTEVVAVDTWAGDDHAGHYDGVYDLVESWTATYYGDVRTRLLRTTFDEARAQVPLGSVDLLHIDGFHSYEAAEHDYSSWSDHLSSRSTVLFHDVEPDCGYGSADFWHDLSSELGGWTFHHSFGLGVLTRDPNLAAWLASPEFATLAQFYPARAEASLRGMQVEDLEAMVEERQALIDHQDALIRDRDAALADQAAMIDEKQRLIDHQDFLIADRDRAITAQTALIDGKQEIIDHQDRLVAERDQAIIGLREQLADLPSSQVRGLPQ